MTKRLGTMAFFGIECAQRFAARVQLDRLPAFEIFCQTVPIQRPDTFVDDIRARLTG
jgi:hypothetical protein